jgi:Na+/proline symporter
MSPYLILTFVGLYFGLLIIISQLTSRQSDNETFFTGKRNSPWYVVAFGMIGASLSGVTFISVPGWVDSSQFSYMQMVLGYLLGYIIIANVLLPMYYKYNLTSIYGYLGQRFGPASYKTGAWFFLVSRMFGSAFRLYIVADVLQFAVFDALGVPFAATVALSLLLIMVYTFKGGIKTIVYTDTLQTFFLLLAVALTIFILKDALLPEGGSLVAFVWESTSAQIFFFDDFFADKRHFIKQFLGGVFIAISMTGLDQDMMQKNLTCRNLKDAQKNMYWFSGSLVLVNLFFLSLGVLLYAYAESQGLAATGDKLYPAIALGNHLSPWVGAIFIIGLIAAAYSSADSALTALTTSFCVDILKINTDADAAHAKKVRQRTHIGMAVVMLLIIVVSRPYVSENIIRTIFEIAGYTYGPLLGMFFFGLFTRHAVRDRWVPAVAIASPIASYFAKMAALQWFGYAMSFELLLLNGALTFAGLWVLRSGIAKI